MMAVVIDTNVMVSANLKAEGLEAKVVRWALNRQAQLHVSEAILAERERALSYRELKFVRAEIAAFLALVRRVARLAEPIRVLAACRHEADNRFLECAEAAQADYLVTGNKRHFPSQWKATRIVNARELLTAIVSE
jgi:putative PIN family toxin of toxin-antitoxin system